MIQKYRNKGAIRLALGFGLMFIGMIVVVATNHSDSGQLGGFIGWVSVIVGYLIYLFGCADLLKAKGYDTSLALAFIIPALCCHLAFVFFAPPVIIFGLKDKTNRRN